MRVDLVYSLEACEQVVELLLLTLLLEVLHGDEASRLGQVHSLIGPQDLDNSVELLVDGTLRRDLDLGQRLEGLQVGERQPRRVVMLLLLELGADLRFDNGDICGAEVNALRHRWMRSLLSRLEVGQVQAGHLARAALDERAKLVDGLHHRDRSFMHLCRPLDDGRQCRQVVREGLLTVRQATSGAAGVLHPGLRQGNGRVQLVGPRRDGRLV